MYEKLKNALAIIYGFYYPHLHVSATILRVYSIMLTSAIKSCVANSSRFLYYNNSQDKLATHTRFIAIFTVILYTLRMVSEGGRNV
jgi:hypothetical protein